MWRDVNVVLFFTGPWVPVASLLVKTLRALKMVQDGMLAASPGVQTIDRSAEGSVCAYDVACSRLPTLTMDCCFPLSVQQDLTREMKRDNPIFWRLKRLKKKKKSF